MKKLILFLLVLICLPLVMATPDRAMLINVFSDEIINLEFDSLTQSYHDAEYDVKVRVFSDDNLENNWLCLIYKVGDSFIEITEGPASETRCEQLVKIDDLNYFDTPNTIKIGDIKAKYPAILYAAISENKNIDLSDTFIKLNPETDGWLIGADGGAPCMGSEGLWVYVPEGCNIENGADPVYDSFDITIKPYQNEIGMAVDTAYYPASEMSAAEIPDGNAKLVVGIGTSLENVFDSAIVAVKEEVKLNYGSYTGKLNVYVNGIKEGEVIITNEGVPSTDLGSEGSGASPSEYWDREEGKLKWVFPIDYALSVTEVTVYLKKSMTRAFLTLNILDKEQIEGKIYGYLSPSSSFEPDNVASVYIKFKILKQWMHDEFLLQDMIFLNYEDGEWKSAETYLLGEDPEYYYFISRMDKLVDFNIGEKLGEVVPLSEEDLSEIAKEIKKELKEEVPITNLTYILLILLFLILFILLIKRKKKKK